MKLPISLVPAGALVLAALGTVITTGCPAPTCPQCTIKKAQFTIPSASGTITDVTMRSACTFTGHCDGDTSSNGCSLTETESLGVIREGERHQEPLPWETDDDDTCTINIDVKRRLADGSVVTQTPAPSVTIVR